MSEIEWMVERAKLYDLKQHRPQASAKRLAKELGHSERWARKWLKRFAEPDEEATTLFCSRSRARQTSNKKVPTVVEEAILAIRDKPPDGLNRIPGPKTILYFLPQHEQIKGQAHYLPRSTSTIWSILDKNNRIHRHKPHKRQPEPLSEPMEAWQMDFKTISSVPAEAGGKKQHVVECLNVIDKGTSVAIDAVARADFHAQTALLTLVDVFTKQGVPRTLTFDRDPRFVGSWTAKSFPSALMRFLLGIGVTPLVCPPQRPQKNAYVERFNRSYKRECLLIHHPTNLADTLDCTDRYLAYYNHKRPHQGRACQNHPPRIAFPDVQPPHRLPAMVDPDTWLTFASCRLYKRRVSTNGSIQLGNYRYYVSKTLAQQSIAVRVQPQDKTLAILTGKTCFKTIAIKGLYNGMMALPDYVEVMLVEVLAESRRLAVRRRQKQRQRR